MRTKKYDIRRKKEQKLMRGEERREERRGEERRGEERRREEKK